LIARPACWHVLAVSRIDDEEIKLIANALDRASTACLAVRAQLRA
jgi:hypothetical protein